MSSRPCAMARRHTSLTSSTSGQMEKTASARIGPESIPESTPPPH